jgi:FKBP-type peptidyl-prolyl cis-trans isomerase
MKNLNQNQRVAVVVGVTFMVFMLFGGTILNVFRSPNNQDENNLEVNRMQANQELPQSGVVTQDLVLGEGALAEPGDKLVVHYVGALPSGKVFDSSLDRGRPFDFTIGTGSVIRGWEEGMLGMQVGGVRRLLIAPDYGYGAQPVGSIPANSTLIFEVELLDVVKQ